MGYQFVPPEADPVISTSSNSDPLLRLISSGGKAAGIPTEELRRLWEHRDARCWSLYPECFTHLAEVFQRSGVPFLTFDVVAEGLRFSSSLRLKQLQALALAQTGTLLARPLNAGIYGKERWHEQIRTGQELLILMKQPAAAKDLEKLLEPQ
jgi:hypothetical protein